MDPRAGLDEAAKKKKSQPLPGNEARTHSQY